MEGPMESNFLGPSFFLTISSKSVEMRVHTAHRPVGFDRRASSLARLI